MPMFGNSDIFCRPHEINLTRGKGETGLFGPINCQKGEPLGSGGCCCWNNQFTCVGLISGMDAFEIDQVWRKECFPSLPWNGQQTERGWNSQSCKMNLSQGTEGHTKRMSFKWKERSLMLIISCLELPKRRQPANLTWSHVENYMFTVQPKIDYFFKQ